MFVLMIVSSSLRAMGYMPCSEQFDTHYSLVVLAVKVVCVGAAGEKRMNQFDFADRLTCCSTVRSDISDGSRAVAVCRSGFMAAGP